MKISKVGIVGAGRIGRDLAYAIASKFGGRAEVVLIDISERALDVAQAHISGLANKGIERGKLSQGKAERILGSIKSSTDFVALSGADLVIESATENPKLKSEILFQIEGIVANDCLIGLTTSSLPLSWMTKGAQNPDRVFLAHPFFPAWKSPPIEITRSNDPVLTERMYDAMIAIGKVPVFVRESVCYAGNPPFIMLMHVATRLVEEEIATAGQVDAVIRDHMGGGGVFTVHDMIRSNLLTYSCLETLCDHGVFNIEGPSQLLLDVGDDLWRESQHWGTEEYDEDLAKTVMMHVYATVLGISLLLIENDVVDPFDLNWLTRAALGFKKGVVEMMQDVGYEHLEWMFTKSGREFITVMNVPRTLQESRDMPQAYRDVKVEVSPSGVAHVKVFRPPVNPLSAHTIDELSEVLFQLEHNSTIKGVVFGGWNGVLAGADVKELARLPDSKAMAEFPRAGQILTLTIENMSKPVIAAVNGLCLGGGAEMAMACHDRVIGPAAMIGQPEVNLGIIPGYGGTQRLPRLVGVEKALEMLRTGEPIDAHMALGCGWATTIAPDPFTAAEERILQDRCNGTPEWSQIKLPDTLPDMDIGHHSKIIDQILVNVVRAGLLLPIDKGLKLEAEGSGQCGETRDCHIGLENFMNNGAGVKAEFIHD